jgi:hypothetical protein
MSAQESTHSPDFSQLFYLDENGTSRAIEPLRLDTELSQEERLIHWRLLMLLAATCDIKDKAEVKALLHDTSVYAAQHNLYTKGFALLYGAVLSDHFVFNERQTEYRLYPSFKEALSTLLPDARLVGPPIHHKKKPDFFVEREGLISPVEIKLHTFTNQAVKQLKAYMNIFGCATGYAVAPKLTGTLLPGMMFLQWPTKEE